ncbi:MAG: hypothetical protein GXO87_14700 [Chlorobi bacterium]|nr:hypothetical protein [Chlorobiota bacterium]
MTAKKFDSLLILTSNDSLRKGLAIGLFDIFLEITSAANPDEILLSEKEKDFSFIITETAFENRKTEEVIKELRVKYPLAKLFIISDRTDEAEMIKLKKLNPQKIYSNLFNLKKLINDIKQIYEN